MKKKEKREKQFHSLEDIEAVLGKRLGSRNRQQGKTQERERSGQRDSRRAPGGHTARSTHRSRPKSNGVVQDFLAEYGRLFVIPLIALVLLAVILLLGRGSDAGTPEPASNVSAEAATPNNAEESSAAEPSLKTCEIPEIRLLVSDYFQAKTDGDAARLYELFGKKEDSQFAAVQKKLNAQRSWIQSFDDVQIYELPGMSADARLILVTYSINFRRTDTLAPGIMYCYVQKNAEGQYILADQLRKETLDYIDEKLQEPLVVELQTSVNNRLSNALNQDSTLALIYTSFVNGEIYSETDLDLDAEQQVDLFLNPEDSYLVDDGGEAGSLAAGETENVIQLENESENQVEIQSENQPEAQAESQVENQTVGQSEMQTENQSEAGE